MINRTKESVDNRINKLRAKGMQNEKLAKKWERIARKMNAQD